MQFAPVKMHDLQRPADVAPEVFQVLSIAYVDLQGQETSPALGETGLIRHILKPTIQFVYSKVFQIAQFPNNDERSGAQDHKKQAGHLIMQIAQDDRQYAKRTGDAIDNEDRPVCR